MTLSAPLYRLKRDAKRLARAANLPLHAALDQIARGAGYRSWSHLASARDRPRPAQRLLKSLTAGDLVLLGARPNQGKTLLGLELAAEAVRAGRPGFFFSLEDLTATVAERLRVLGFGSDPADRALVIDSTDEICADYIAARLQQAGDGAVAVIDYLQILDQPRGRPELGAQVATLKAAAQRTGATIVAIAQIDRHFDASGRRLPNAADVRLPNPVDLSQFSKHCFLHDGRVDLTAVR